MRSCNKGETWKIIRYTENLKQTVFGANNNINGEELKNIQTRFINAKMAIEVVTKHIDNAL